MGTCMKLTPTDSCPTAKLCRRSWNLTPALAGRAGSIVPSRRLRSALAGWLTDSRAAAKAGERLRRENVDKSIGSDPCARPEAAPVCLVVHELLNIHRRAGWGAGAAVVRDP